MDHKIEFLKCQMGAGETGRLPNTKRIGEIRGDDGPGFRAFSTHHKYIAKDTSRVPVGIETRSVFTISGWPIDFFKDLRELLTVVRDAIQDHQLMHDQGVLHGDISPESIIIQPSRPNLGLPLKQLVAQTNGKLIDADYQKLVFKNEAPKIFGDIYDDDISSIRRRRNVTKDVVVDAWKFAFVGSGTYCMAAIALNVLESIPIGEWTPEDLGWEDVGKVPDYGSHVPSVIERTGTIPFISHELMTKRNDVIHNAIHDLESFWWVIVYLCLTRESGGGHRRENPTKELHALVRDLFNPSDPTIGLSKAVYFRENTGAASFETLLNHFPKYFEPLKPMLKRWQSVLTLGYTFKAYEYHLVHKYVLTVINDTLNSLPITQGRSAVIDNELLRREESYGYICPNSSTFKTVVRRGLCASA